MTHRLSTVLALAIPVSQHQRFDRVGRDFRYWHETDMPSGPDDVRFRGKTGSHGYTVKVTRMVESRCGAVALGRAYLLPPLSSGGALVVQP